MLLGSECEREKEKCGRQYPSPFSPSGGFNSISPALWQLTFSARGQKFLGCTSRPCVSLALLGGVYSFKRALERQTKLSLSSRVTRTLQFASQINGPGPLDNALSVRNPLIRRPSYYCGASSVIHLRQGRRHKGPNKAPAAFAYKKIFGQINKWDGVLLSPSQWAIRLNSNRVKWTHGGHCK